MANLTLYIPDRVKRMMNRHPNVRWSRAIRSIIEQKLTDFEEAERLAKKSGLTAADAARIARKIDAALGRHAKALLNESRR
jgi:hypothetical protein